MENVYYKKFTFGALGFILVLLLWQVATGQDGNVQPMPMIVEYCELVKSPKKYDGKDVTVRATFRYGFEWSEIFCLECRDLGKTWLDFGKLTKKTEKTLKKFPKDDATINAVFTGTFDGSGGGGYRFRFLLKEMNEAKLVTKSSADPERLSVDERKKVCLGRAKTK